MMRRHRFDIASFVFGVLFVGLGLTAAFADEDVSFLEVRWIWPALLVAGGLAILGYTLRRHPEGGDTATQPYDPVD